MTCVQEDGCIVYAALKAVIIHQADYSMTRMVDCKGCMGCGNLPATLNDAKVAKVIANGFGIEDKDILFLSNKNNKQINDELNKIKREFRTFSRKN